MPDFLEKRYSRTCCDVLVVLSLVLYVLTKISATLYAGQLIVSEVLHVNEFLAVLFLIAVTTVYTAVGGLLAVILTDQTWKMKSRRCPQSLLHPIRLHRLAAGE